jgi:hypothetical protein
MLLNKEQKIIFRWKNILRNYSDMPKTLKKSGKVFKKGASFPVYPRNYCKMLKKDTAVVRMLERQPNFFDCQH